MSDKAVYITWTEEKYIFDHWHYSGNGYTDAVNKPVTIKRHCRYSSDTSGEMIKKAENYIKTDMADRPSAKVEILAR